MILSNANVQTNLRWWTRAFPRLVGLFKLLDWNSTALPRASNELLPTVRHDILISSRTSRRKVIEPSYRVPRNHLAIAQIVFQSKLIGRLPTVLHGCWEKPKIRVTKKFVNEPPRSMSNVITVPLSWTRRENGILLKPPKLAQRIHLTVVKCVDVKELLEKRRCSEGFIPGCPTGQNV